MLAQLGTNPLGGVGGGAGGGRGIGAIMSLPLEFRLVLVIAGALVVLVMGLSKIIQGQGGHAPPKWARRYGLRVEVTASALALVTIYSTISYAILNDLEPIYGPILLAIITILPGMIGITALVDLGRQRAWIWSIQKGPIIKSRLTVALFLGVLTVIAITIVRATLA